MERDLTIIRRKRIIGCTTTAAAKYVQALQAISPGVLLVEEAGEILESHILTALGPETKQLILIGDHKQLRPKVHYDLSVEKGQGYDLNRSLFERLVLKGYPHRVLSQQHRMRPEISALVRQLTYPDLVDAPKTQGRPNLRGFQDNLIFVNHSEPEMELPDVPDWRDNTSTSSKENMFEASMTLKCVRYLGQQGYRTDNLVILTPYLGQLRLLRDELGKDNDPVLNDLDSYDLVRAGLMPAASADMNKPRIRISTIGKQLSFYSRSNFHTYCSLLQSTFSGARFSRNMVYIRSTLDYSGSFFFSSTINLLQTITKEKKAT
jgi:superfamily I DNA and/or RNA helicase